MADRRYWDSACFIAVLAKEEGRVSDCNSILLAAEEGRIEIVTSAFTITEVLWPKGRERLTPEVRDIVTTFFRRKWILIVDVDRRLAEEAQRYVWERNIQPKDAVHVASAIRAKVPVLETYDGGLIKSSGRVGGSPPLHIREPVPVDLPDDTIELFADEVVEP